MAPELEFGAILVLGLLSSLGDGCSKHLLANNTVLEERQQGPIRHRRVQGTINVNTTHALHTVDRRFLSIAISPSLLRKHWKNFDFNSIKLQNLARGLSPAILRFGSTDSDFIIFNSSINRSTAGKTRNDGKGERFIKDSTYSKTYYRTNFTMTTTDWDNINKFASDAGWDMLFALNMILRNGSRWDPTNAIKLMEYSTKKGYRVTGWEMGNEPNHINHHANLTLPADQLGRDFIALRQVLDTRGYKDSFLIGPGVTPPIPKRYKGEKESRLKQDGRTYLRSFLQNCGNSTSATSWHYYNLYGPNATAENFTDPAVMNAIVKQMYKVQRFINKYRPYLPQSWIAETAGAFSGGAPGLSDAYAGGFLWLDRLGASAANGVGIVVRMAFFGSSYGLVSKQLEPTPVYWVSYLYKQLVGTIALQANISIQNGREEAKIKNEILRDINPATNSSHIRVYAHCTNTNSSHGSTYSNGSVTVFVINLKKSRNVSLKLAGALSHYMADVFQYLLIPRTQGIITSTEVKLNGNTLKMTEDTAIPTIKGRRLTLDETISLPPLTYGFFVVNATSDICV